MLTNCSGGWSSILKKRFLLLVPRNSAKIPSVFAMPYTDFSNCHRRPCGHPGDIMQTNTCP